MAESTPTPTPTPTRHHLLDEYRAAFAALPDGVSITVEAGVASAGLRVPPTQVPTAVAALGLPVPTTPNTWAAHDTTRVVWLGPDEWLVLGATSTPEELETGLRERVVPLGGSAVDVSAQRVGLRLTGRHVRDLLATGCALDLHPRVFGAGRCAQTTVGQAGVVLIGLDDAVTDVLLLVRPSFAGYLADWLLDAAEEFRAD